MPPTSSRLLGELRSPISARVPMRALTTRLMSTATPPANQHVIGATSQLLAAAARASSDMPPNSDALLVKVSGHDKTGITAAFAELLAETGCEFYDMDQPWCQPWCNKNLSLYFLVGMPRSSDQEVNLIRSLLAKSQRVGLDVEFEIVSNEDLVAATAQLAAPQGLVVTLLKPTLGFEEIAAVARTATEGGFTISKIKRLSTLQHGNSHNEASPERSAFHSTHAEDCATATANVPNISAVEVCVPASLASAGQHAHFAIGLQGCAFCSP